MTFRHPTQPPSALHPVTRPFSPSVMHVKRVTLTSKKNWWMGPSLSSLSLSLSNSRNPSSRTRPGATRLEFIPHLLRGHHRRARRRSLPAPQLNKIPEPIHTRLQTPPSPHLHLLLPNPFRLLCSTKSYRKPCSLCTGFRLRPIQVCRKETGRRPARDKRRDPVKRPGRHHPIHRRVACIHNHLPPS